MRGATWASSALLQHIFTIFGGDEYMFGKKVFAAMLATVLGASLFGANAAKAVINLDATTDKSAAVATYAAETITEKVPDSDGYYKVDGSPNAADNLNVTGMVGLGGPANTVVTIRFEFDGMVLSTGFMDDSLSVDGHSDINIRTGGNVGENFVSFLASRLGAASRTSVATLTIGDIGVKPGVAGSVTMTVTDTLGPDKVILKYNGAIRNTRALIEIADPKYLTATVEQRFKSFGGMTMGTLGSFMVRANTDLLAADDGEAVVLEEDIIEDTVALGSSVTISGDFSFVTRAWLDTAETCLETENLLQMKDGEVSDTMELTAVDPSAVTTEQFLCIAVPMGEDAVAIPETEPYMVTTAYAAGTMDAGWPPNGGEHSLGSIERDGTTVHIPFLTTWADYNQRIVVSNRGANPAPYWITFRPEEGVMATPGMYATGMLAGDSTMVLRAGNVVTLEGGNRTAATFVAEAQSSQIDVATVIVNMMNGSTDTVNYSDSKGR